MGFEFGFVLGKAQARQRSKGKGKGKGKREGGSVSQVGFFTYIEAKGKRGHKGLHRHYFHAREHRHHYSKSIIF